jgi:hypothetical protein
MATSQIVIVVDRETLRNFRAECIRRGTTPTKELGALMSQRLKEWLPLEPQREAHAEPAAVEG